MTGFAELALLVRRGGDPIASNEARYARYAR